MFKASLVKEEKLLYFSTTIYFAKSIVFNKTIYKAFLEWLWIPARCTGSEYSRCQYIHQSGFQIVLLQKVCRSWLLRWSIC